MPQVPSLQRGAGHLELFGGLTLGHALGWQLTIMLEAVRTFASIPAWLAVIVAWGRILAYGSQSALLGQSLAFG